VDRDCGVEKHLLDPAKCLTDNTCSYLSEQYQGYFEQDPETVATMLHGNVGNGVILSRKWDREQGCVESKGTISIMGSGIHDAYSGRSETDYTYRAILSPAQPFSFANDVTLTGVRDSMGNYFVSVNRLFGNENNEFTMVNVQKTFPATAPADVQR
jgi:hypothetical protein